MKKNFLLVIPLSVLMLCFSLVAYSQSTTFSYTGSVQTYTVPCGVTSLSVDVRGARGGYGYNSYSRGGYGGRVACSLAVTPGQVIYIYVGSSGNTGTSSTYATGGYNGGATCNYYRGGGGGGASDIRIGGTALSNRVVVAGGGGGGGYYTSTSNYSRGGGGGTTTGQAGYYASSSGYSSTYCGWGGTQTSGGSAGTYSSPDGVAGSLGNGGAGGYYGGGGGGGYYGGGGGTRGGGGGGSNYANTTYASSVSHSQDYNNGDGSVIITGLGFTASPDTLSFDSLAAGTSSVAQTTTLSASYAGTGPLTITPPTGFEVSLDGTTWSSSAISYSYAGTSFAAFTLHIRFSPATAGHFAGTIGFSSSGISCGMGVSGDAAGPCSETPAPGVVAITPTSGSTATTFDLSLTGSTIAGGITYQWQSSPYPTSGFSNIPGATNTTHSFTGISGNVYFRALVACPSFAPAHSNTVTAASVISFAYTGAVQTYTVPCGVTSIQVDMKGARGGFGYGSYSRGGYGGRVVCSLSVTPGQVLYLNVGGYGNNGSSGSYATGGFNGGAGCSYTYGGGGGGATDIRIGSNTLSNRVVVAGGGGGGGYYTSSSNYSRGGGGGSTTGQAGSYSASVGYSTTYCGWGGTQTSGGSGATYSSPDGGVGTQGNGGNGGYYGGGGGGGYYGGGGGSRGGGGGGSNYANTSYTSSVSHSQDYNNGNGEITLTGTGYGIVLGTGTLFFDTLSPGATSLVQTTTMSAALVTAGDSVMITPPSGYEVSLNGSTWSSSPISYIYSGTSFSGVTIYIRFSPATPGNYNSTVDINGGGLSTCGVNVEGACTQPCDTVTLNAGILSPSAPILCTQGVTTITPTGATSDFVNGLTYQWQASEDSTLWSPVAGATSRVYAMSSPISVTTYYRLVMGCATNATSVDTAIGKVVVNPSAILGTPMVCMESVATLADSTSGGTWSSSTPSVATINATTGVVTPVSIGTTRITYTLTLSGCYATKQITVNPLPGSIYGTPVVCAGASTTLVNITPGGSWSTGAATVAMVGSSSGIITGVSSGTVPVSYTLPTGCYRVVTASVNPLPVLSITPSGSATTCMGDTASFRAVATMPGFTLLSQDFNAGLGAWTINSPVDPGDGVSPWGLVSASAAGTTGDGSAMVEAVPFMAPAYNPVTSYLTSPAFSTMGFGSVNLSFNEFLFSTASGDLNVAVQYSTDNGATWTTFLDQLGSVVGSGSWTASAPEVSVALPAAALNEPSVKLRWYYNVTVGAWWNVDNITVNAALPAPTYVWAPVGSASGLSCTACDSVDIVPATAGVNLYSITATSASGCSTSGGFVSVVANPSPAVISGTTVLCAGDVVTLSNTTPGGSWSGSDAGIANVNSLSGVVTGISAGTVVITYAMPSGCKSTVVITVNATPAAITGTSQMCNGLSTTLSTIATGGTWSSAATSVASVDAAGVVTGNSFGITTISYTAANGCAAVKDVTVNATPASITSGTFQVCEGQTINLTSATTGGTWTSSDAGVATVVAGSGIVTGVAAAGTVPATATISYTLPAGCMRTQVVTVLPTPAAITGAMSVCAGETTNLTSATTGGSWSSGSFVTATVGITSGVVTAGTAGVAPITYTLSGGCFTTANVIVNQTPAPISGTLSVCEGSSATLINTTGGGTWSATNGNVTVDASGVITGVTSGTATIIYAMPAGCSRSADITVNTLPSVISGSMAVCQGAGTTLSSTPAGGTWTSGAPGVAAIDAATGVVTASPTGAGTSPVTYTLANGCKAMAELTVNVLPAPISGTLSVCEGGNATLTNTTGGGTWSSSNGNVTIDASGVIGGVTSGTSTIVYTLGTGCTRSADVTVNTLPSAISGSMAVCQGSGTTLSSTPAGGTWTSGAPGVAAIDAATGVVTASVTGAGASPVTYTLPNGCRAMAAITVNALPAPISGILSVCEGSSAILTNTTGGGTWSSSNGNVTIDASGVIGGVTSGTSTIVYTLGTGCTRSADVTVNTLPSAISGSMAVCQGAGTTLSSTPAGGTWTSGAPGVAAIDAATGVVTASVTGAGTSPVTYTLANGCKAMAAITVNALPAPISGTLSVCEGSSATLTNTTGGGTWSSSNGNVTIDASGVIGGVTSGTSTIVYTLGTGCTRSADVTVNTLPSVISGSMAVCQGAGTTLSSTPAGGTWTSGAPGVAAIDAATGVVTASATGAGTSPVTYTLANGCKAMAAITVNALPAPISGTLSVCEGSSATLTNTTGGGTWSSSNGNVTVDASGVIGGVTSGTSTIVYTLGTGCTRSADVTVNTLPSAISGSMAVCQGAGTTLSSTPAGGTWTSGAPGVAAIDAATGVVTASATGAGTSPVTYTLANGCKAMAAITVNVLPAPILGTLSVCEGSSATLTNTTGGGTWSSSNGNVTIDASGVIGGITSGTSTIVYTLGTGCTRSADVTVNMLPSVISGSMAVCQGAGTTLSSTPAGGTWTSGASAIATIDPASGSVTASLTATGIVPVTYTAANGCEVMTSITVNALPAPVTGLATVCQSAVILLSNSSAGGTWSSSDPSVAGVGSTTGAVTGVAAGTTTVSYTLPSGCAAAMVVTVNIMPDVITGVAEVCQGSTIALSSVTSGGVWVSSVPAVASVDATGTVSGNIAGTTTISYAIGACTQMVTVTVNDLPAAYPVTGGGNYCAGSAGADVSISGSESGVQYQLYNGTSTVGTPLTGTGSTLSFGAQTLVGTYSVSAADVTSGCAIPMSGMVTVSVVPVVVPSVSLTATSGTTVCDSTSVTYFATSVNGGTTPVFTWEVNGVTVSGVDVPLYNYMPVNGDVVKVTLASSEGCAVPATVSAMLTMTVNTSVTPSVVIAGDNSVCEGNPVVLTAATTMGGTMPELKWIVNGAEVSGATNDTFSFVPASGDLVHCILTSSMTCKTAPFAISNMMGILTNPEYVPVVSIDVNPGLTVSSGTSVTFTANYSGAGFAPDLQWYVNSVPVAGATNMTYTTATLQDGDSVSCNVTATEECGHATINAVKMAITPATGVSAVVRNMSLMLYPNPNTGDFIIKGSVAAGNGEPVAIEITNVLGQTVYKGSITSANGNINGKIALGNDLSNGIYLVNLKCAEEVQVIHFVLER